MTDKPTRYFTAVFLPPEAQREFARLRGGSHRHVKWVKPDQAHVTLCYYGEAQAPQLAVLKTALSGLPPLPAPDILTIPGLSIFENDEHVLYMKVVNHHQLAPLHYRQRFMAEGLGFPRQKYDFNPHITVATAPPACRDMLRSATGYRHNSCLQGFVPTSYALVGASRTRRGDTLHHLEGVYPFAPQR